VPTPPVALTIAGTDSAGGAGVHADLRTFAAFGVHGATAVAAVTAQSTARIDAVHLLPTDVVVAQIDSVVADLDVRATKTGFLGSVEVVEAVARIAADGRLRNVVVDPVLVRSDGEPLFPHEVTAAYLERLLPRATVITPNRLEAGLLTGRALETVADMAEAAHELSSLGPALVVVKGGDAADEGDESIDVVVAADGSETRLRMPRVDTANDHGTGCSFASASAACLALGHDAADAVRTAKRFVHDALVGSVDWRLGAGHGPIDQLGFARRGTSTVHR